jgi:hypothetical protein
LLNTEYVNMTIVNMNEFFGIFLAHVCNILATYTQIFCLHGKKKSSTLMEYSNHENNILLTLFKGKNKRT